MNTKIVIIALFVSISAVSSSYGGLLKVEKLTQDEVMAITEARARVFEAEVQLKEEEKKIAANHGMKEESYMEWSTSVVIRDEYIFLQKKNHISN